MLIGLNSKKPVAVTNDSDDIYSVTTQDFETRILAESQKRPVLIDFWAPWCGPCKQLMPVIEQAVAARNGKVALAKVNIDDNPELAQAFRVQSVPTVIAFFMGQPVSGFQGARPKSEIENLINQLEQLQRQQQPDALDIPAALKEAAEFCAGKNFEMAHQIYASVLEQDPNNGEAFAGMIRVFIATGQIEAARDLSENLPEAVAKDQNVISARMMLDLLSAAPQGDDDGLRKKLQDSPDDPELNFELAELSFARNQREEAVDALVRIIRKNKAWEDEKARKQLLKYFEAWGHNDPATIAGRRKLSSLLFS